VRNCSNHTCQEVLLPHIHPPDFLNLVLKRFDSYTVDFFSFIW